MLISQNNIKQIIHLCLQQGKEGDYWDFKQEWHTDTTDLIKDIICFANTVHNKDCYLIFGISDDLKIIGMKKKRRKQADIIDTLSHLPFAGDVSPKISVETVNYNGTTLDVLIIYNTDLTPIYLKKNYGKMRQGCIYTRIGDKNTPNGENADFYDIENLWKKRFSLVKPPLEYIYDHMQNKMEWRENNDIFHNIYSPEYTIEITGSTSADQFYSYAMVNESTLFQTLNIKYQNTILDSYETVILDGGRLHIPTPEWGYIRNGPYNRVQYRYKYYIIKSNRYRVFTFLYDSNDHESNYACAALKDIILFYHSQAEQRSFEKYLETHLDLLSKQIEKIDSYNSICINEALKASQYKKLLQTGAALTKLLHEWRQHKNQ